MTDECRQQLLKQVQRGNGYENCTGWVWWGGKWDPWILSSHLCSLLRAPPFCKQLCQPLEFHSEKSVSDSSNKMFSSPLRNVLCSSGVVKWVSGQHLLEFFYSRKSEKSSSALLKSMLGLISRNKADRWAGRVIDKLQQKGAVLTGMLSCLFHSALCVLQILCTKTSVIFRSLYLDVIVCCSVQDKGYLWRWEERDRAAEPMGLLPEPDSVTSGLRKKGLFIISSHSYQAASLRFWWSLSFSQVLFLQVGWLLKVSPGEFEVIHLH